VSVGSRQRVHDNVDSDSRDVSELAMISRHCDSTSIETATALRSNESLRELINQQLTAVEQVLAISGELVRRLDRQSGTELEDLASALRLARSTVNRPPAPTTGAKDLAPARRGAGDDGGNRAHDYSGEAGCCKLVESSEPLLGNVPVPEDLTKTVSAEKLEGLKRLRAANLEQSHNLFADADSLKQQMKKVLQQNGDSDEEDLYFDEGWAQAVARNGIFKQITTLVIFLSCLWIAVDTDITKMDASRGLKTIVLVVDNVFFIYFCSEISIRSAAFKNKCDAFKLFRYNFDFALVLLMALSGIISISGKGAAGSQVTSSLRIFRLFRLARLARLIRLVRSFQSLLVLVRGMMTAVRAVCSTICLLVIITYVFAVFFTQLLSGNDAVEGCFDNVPQAMNCLLVNAIFNSQGPFIETFLGIHWFYYVCILAFVMLACLTVMNMMIAVVCETIATVAKAESDAQDLLTVKKVVSEALTQLDIDHDGMISKRELYNLFNNADVVRKLHGVSVDVFALIECSEFIFAHGDMLTFDEFLEDVAMFRSSKACTVKDAVDIRLFLKHELKKTEDRLRFAFANSESFALSKGITP